MLTLASSAALAASQNPLCGKRIKIGSQIYSIADASVQSEFCGVEGEVSIKILSSPSGLAHGNGSGVFVQVLNDDSTTYTGTPIAEFWAAGEKFAGDQCEASGPPIAFPVINHHAHLYLECGDPDFRADGCSHAYVDLPNVATTGTTWYPAFGGAGILNFYVAYDAPGGGTYDVLTHFYSRSTDIDYDGDTDEEDENDLRSKIAEALATPSSIPALALTYDLTFDAQPQIDSTDLSALIAEANRRYQGMPHRRGHCAREGRDENGVWDPGLEEYDVQDYKMFRPEEISNLSVTCVNGVPRLSWTATGDDSLTGTATIYEIRWSASPITAGNYASAAVLDSFPGAASGSPMSYDDTGAGSSSRYYAIKAHDDMFNWSAMSNVASTTPASVTLGGTTGPSTIAVTWNAPGNVCNSGTASSFDLRVSTSTFTAATFSQQQQVSTPSPGQANTAHCAPLSGLPSNTNHYFALKTQDAAGNWSAMSTVKLLKTKVSGGEVACEGFSARPVTGDEHLPEEKLSLNFVLGSQGAARLSYFIPAQYSGQRAELVVFDVVGRVVHQQREAAARAGVHELDWSARAGNSGYFFARLRVGSEEVRKSFFGVK
jgi:hypothetical protein